jgi:GNAT superfamily N-acetyltransferase
MEVAARRAAPGDGARLAELATMARSELESQRGGQLFLAREGRAGAEPPELTVVGTLDDAVLGFTTAGTTEVPDIGLIAVLGALYVEPGGREVGIGEAMMDLVLEWCAERGCDGIDAVALPGMRATKNFFERYGLTARALLVHRPLGRRADQGPTA